MPKGKDRNKRFKEIQKSALLSEYALHDVVKEHRAKGGFTKRIGINEAQKIATRVWQGIERRLLCGESQSPQNCARVSTIPKRERTVRKLFGREVIRWEIRAGTWTATLRPP